MATRRALLRTLAQSTACIAARSTLRFQPRDLPSFLWPTAARHTAAVRSLQKRWHSKPAGEDFKVYDFEKIKDLVENPQENIILIDVREPHEYNEGFIPTALNVPITSHPDALFLSPEEFQDRFGFSKPPLSKEVVFYCKSGVRSSAAAQMARQHGYQDVVEYRGSWLDWTKNGGSSSKEPTSKGSAKVSRI